MKLLGIIVIMLIALSGCLNESNSSDDSSSENFSVIEIFDSPGDKITGLAWGDESLWAVDAVTNRIFRIDTDSGQVIDSFACNPPSSFETTGLAYSEQYDTVFLGLWNNGNSGYVFQYSTDGEFLGSTSMCGG